MSNDRSANADPRTRDFESEIKDLEKAKWHIDQQIDRVRADRENYDQRASEHSSATQTTSDRQSKNLT